MVLILIFGEVLGLYGYISTHRTGADWLADMVQLDRFPYSEHKSVWLSLSSKHEQSAAFARQSHQFEPAARALDSRRAFRSTARNVNKAADLGCKGVAAPGVQIGMYDTASTSPSDNELLGLLVKLPIPFHIFGVPLTGE